MPEIILTSNYRKTAVNFFKKRPSLKGQYAKTLLFLKDNPFHPSLRLHKLKGNLKDFYSVNINMQYRIMIDFIIKDDQIFLLDIGEHDELYGE